MSSSQDLTETPIFDEYVDLVPVGPSWRVNFLPRLTHGKKATSWWRRYWLVVLIGVLPTVLAATYLFGFAEDRYYSEARFSVRKPKGTGGTLAELLETSGISHATDEAYAVQEYVKSRDAMDDLAAHHSLDAVFGRYGSDFLWSFPSEGATAEDRYDHFSRFISTTNDTTTGIGTIEVQAFRPEDAFQLAVALTDAAEKMINRMNDRANGDALAAAEKQSDSLKARVDASQAALVEFRTREKMVDPTKMSVAELQIIAALSIQLAETQATLSDLESTSPQSPQVGVLRRRIAAIQNQITAERQKLGGGDASLANSISEYESLILEREFAQKAYSAALAAVEVTRSENQKDRIYLERIVEPRVADAPSSPHRMLWLLGVFFASMAVLRIVTVVSKPN